MYCTYFDLLPSVGAYKQRVISMQFEHYILCKQQVHNSQQLFTKYVIREGFMN